jgi:hypothetical protein
LLLVDDVGLLLNDHWLDVLHNRLLNRHIRRLRLLHLDLLHLLHLLHRPAWQREGLAHSLRSHDSRTQIANNLRLGLYDLLLLDKTRGGLHNVADG